ncbi:MAG: sensor domain-containing diguanylate cyclase [Acholeplasma sp.]|nr:sensor domain-containing diguanylate cyclase [Acholeplasma sp.]
MLLDVRTLYLSGSIIGLIFALSLIEVWYINKYRYKGLFEWILSILLLSIGTHLTVYRHANNVFFTIYISNLLVFIGYTLLIRGFCRFMMIHNYPKLHAVVLFISSALFLYYLYVYDSLQARHIIVGLVSLYAFSVLSYMIFRKMPIYYAKTTRFLAAVSVSFVGMNLLKVIYMIFNETSHNDLFDNHISDVVSGVAIVFYMTLLPISILVLIHNRAQSEISVEEVKFESAFYESPIMMVISKLDTGLIMDVNRAFETLLGFSREEVVGKTSTELGIWGSETQRQAFFSQIDHNNRVKPKEVKFYTKDKRELEVIFSSSSMEMMGERTVISLASDVTELAVAKQKLIYMATHDALTGLLNRHQLTTHFGELVMEFLNTKKGFTLVFMDLDRFKPINDTYGHDFGDLVLIEVGKILNKIYHNNFVARLGGDEFIVLLRSTVSEVEVIDKMIRTRQMIEHLNSLQGNEISMGASLGHATYPNDGRLLEELIRVADEKMYQEKSNKRS